MFFENHRFAIQSLNIQFVLICNSHLARFEEYNPLGIFKDGRQIRCQIHLFVSDTNYYTSGIADSGCNDLVWFPGREDHNPVSTFEMRKGFTSCFSQVCAARKVAFDQMNDNFCVCI